MKKKNHPYIIAEIGSNHNQDIMKHLFNDIAKKAGANAVKFQILKLKIYIKTNLYKIKLKNTNSIPHGTKN